MQAVDEGLMDQPIFTTFMKKCDGECEDGGALTLGGFDDKNCQEPIHWAPVVTGTSMWRFKISGVSVNSFTNQAIDYFAITDSGTSYIQIPTVLFKQIVAELKAELKDGFYLMPCNSKFRMEFTINGKTFPVTEKEVLLNQGFGNQCVVAIGDAGQFDMFLLGDAFIRGHCQVYDVKEKKVGFAAVRPTANTPVATPTNGNTEQQKMPEASKPAAPKKSTNNRRKHRRGNANKTRPSAVKPPVAAKQPVAPAHANRL